MSDTKYCAFCGMSEHEVPKMIGNSKLTTLICQECVGLAHKTLFTPSKDHEVSDEV